MKKVFLLSIFFLVSFYSFSQTTATLELSGHVDSIISVEIQNLTTNDFDLSVSETNYLIGTLFYQCNDPDGFYITVNSYNNFNFVTSNTGINTQLPYTLELDSVVLFNNTNVVDINTIVSNAEQDLTLSYIGSNILQPGSYSDTVSFTIVAK